jgi:hypothetical protein
MVYIYSLLNLSLIYQISALIFIKFNLSRQNMSDSEEEFYNTEPIRIEGPGLGQNRKSFSKFVDLDLARLVHTGLAVDRPGDESYVNAFDIKN